MRRGREGGFLEAEEDMMKTCPGLKFTVKLQEWLCLEFVEIISHNSGTN